MTPPASASAATAGVLPSETRVVPNAVLGMLIFLGAEVMLFAGLISAFLVLRAGMESWPPPDQPQFPLIITGLNTAVLLASGGTMLWARARLLAGHTHEVARLVGITAALGATFVIVQGIEWMRLAGHGLTMVGGVYGGLFATLIGTHAAHVLGGVGAVVWGWSVARGPGISDESLTAVMLYWMFVVGVWPLLFWLVYLS